MHFYRLSKFSPQLRKRIEAEAANLDNLSKTIPDLEARQTVLKKLLTELEDDFFNYIDKFDALQIEIINNIKNKTKKANIIINDDLRSEFEEVIQTQLNKALFAQLEPIKDELMEIDHELFDLKDNFDEENL